ncbi:amino acid dehydrogenase [Lysobacter arseniciresistens ZS79]|uniref:Amino acid dehydrogenase n=1 Tax=Lysobacter arseniciresistens ZS79 TaxID=913325 RepID=A0A0A0F386_9GAMM|nr:FAD-dependent oxidoreductase [Lysobacter arseniciresistens]KGM57005.1 amino acid dehydrogenase [Lysobacter arseniciresistens ZS79]
MDRREDVVVVVGAGVIGLASALALIEAGRSVRVYDAGRVGGGSSHGNCGTITPSHAPPLAAPGMVATALRMMLTPDAPLYVRPRLDPVLWRWMWRFAGRCNLRDWESSARAKSQLLNDSRARLQEWIGRYRLDCGFRESGEDYVFRTAAKFEHDQREIPLLGQLGIDVEVIDGAAYEAMEPAVKPGVAGAIRFTGDAVLRPDRYVAELARTVRERGGVVVEQAPLESLSATRDGVELRIGGEVVHAREVVLALGAWSPRLAAAVGLPWLRAAMQPGKGYSITYSLPPLVPRRPLILRERSVCVTAWDHEGDHGGFRLGSTMEFSGFDDSLNERRLGALERGAAEYLHQPAGPELRERWCGWRPMSCDDIPIIGRAPGHGHLWLATGHGMMGVGMSAGTGQLVADLLTGRAPEVDPLPYRPDRFG